MRKIVRKLLLLSILLCGTQAINLPIGGFSLFQIALIVSGVSIVIYFIMKPFIKRGKYLNFSIVYVLSSILAFFMSTNLAWAKSYLLLGLMTAMLVFSIPNFFSTADIPLLEKTLIRSQYIVFPFSFYSFYMHYFGGGIPEHINLFAGLYIDLEKDALLRSQAAGQVRLTLPYATPPVLSVVMGMCIIILLFDKNIFSKGKRYFLIALFAVVLILTGSRTGMVGMGMILAIFLVSHFKRKVVIPKTIFFLILLVIPVLILGFVIGNNIDYIERMTERFMITDLLTDRHFLVPIEGIIIWCSSLKNFILGIGFGSSINIVGHFTHLPPYFLNSYITLLAERGVMGGYLVVCLISLGGRLYKHWKRFSSQQLAITFALLTGLFSCIFYEAINCYFLIFVIAISFLVEKDLDLIKVGEDRDKGEEFNYSYYSGF